MWYVTCSGRSEWQWKVYGWTPDYQWWTINWSCNENKIGIDEDNFGALEGYKSDNEKELPFTPLNDPKISE